MSAFNVLKYEMRALAHSLARSLVESQVLILMSSVVRLCSSIFSH